MTEPQPPYHVGQIVNGHRWTGATWEPVETVAYPPPPGAPTGLAPAKKAWYRRWWGIGLVAFGVLVLSAAVFGGGADDPTATSEPTAAATPTPEPEVTSAEPTPSEEETTDEPTPTEEETTEEAVDDTVKKGDHESLTSRELALIVKDPDSHIGENVVVYTDVAQFDSSTGTDTFRGYVANKDVETDFDYWDSDNNSLFIGDEEDLAEVVQNDILKVWATVGGSFSYDTQIGGSTTVPVFTVNYFDVIGSTE